MSLGGYIWHLSLAGAVLSGFPVLFLCIMRVKVGAKCVHYKGNKSISQPTASPFSGPPRKT